MDTSPEYIRMCEALPAEFWTGWKDEAGGFIEFQDSIYTTVANREDHDYECIQEADSKMYIGFFDGSYGGMELKESEYTWLPRLDQLLEIAGGRSSKIHILSCFCKWVESQELQDATWGMKFQTYEQMALLFVMHELYSMTWNGERWEKVE